MELRHSKAGATTWYAVKPTTRKGVSLNLSTGGHKGRFVLLASPIVWWHSYLCGEVDNTRDYCTKEHDDVRCVEPQV